MNRESISIITPSRFSLPALAEDVFLFFMQHHFHLFREIIHGGKVSSFGPAKRFSFTRDGKDYSVLGGFIGAPLAVIVAEHAVVSGGRRFKSFGTAGAIGSKPFEIGQIHRPAKGVDYTGIIKDYGGEKEITDFVYSGHRATCRSIVSVNAFYRLTPENLQRYRNQSADLIDMEAAPLNYVIKRRGASLQPLFVVSDRVEEDMSWHYEHNTSGLNQGITAALHQLL